MTIQCFTAETMRDCFIWVYSLKENGDVHLKKDAATYSGSAVFNFVWLSLVIGNTFNFPNRYIFRHHQHYPPHVSARQYLPILCVIFCPFSLKKKKAHRSFDLTLRRRVPTPGSTSSVCSRGRVCGAGRTETHTLSDFWSRSFTAVFLFLNKYMWLFRLTVY